ncbi:hypothetical protein CSUI_003755 [Cystoisospora suis]|uniref:Uncharacterized protein n=1 Tax=Cystoisospora suis TaxID=483139 RepID=A0A2C6KPI1_9APIC|nr:hypothetical protein CSUI_003755 [Cystoisospora suis]
MRFAPRVHAHASLVKTAQVMGECWKKKVSVEHFLSQIDEQTFRENPSIQDLHAVYRTLSKEKVMKFAVDPQIWRDPKFTWKDTPEENKRLDDRNLERENKGAPSVSSEHPPQPSTTHLHNTHQRRERGKSSVKDSEKDGEVYMDLPDLLWFRTLHTDAVRSVCLPPPSSPTHTTGPRRLRSGSRGSSGFVRDKSSAPDEDDIKQTVASTHIISGVRTPQKKDIPQEQLPSSFSLSSCSSRKTRSQSCLLALGEAEDAENSSCSSSSSSSRMQTPSIATVQVGLDCKPRETSMLSSRMSDTTSEIGRRKRSLQHKAACQLLKTALEKDEKLATYYRIRHRFFDPLFRRKRLSFLDRFTRERIKADKERQIGTRLYVKHPDQKPLWPDNKGLVTRTWPSPFH